MTTEPPTLREAPVRVFISYAWESFQYRQQVKRLATRLRADGIDARLDAWHLSGSTIPDFMNREVRRADKVLVVCSPEYRRKVHAMEDGRVTGVGWEAMLVTADVFSMGEGRSKIEPVLLRGAWVDSALLFIQGLPYADLSDPATFEANYRELIRRLTGHTETAPDLGPLPTDIEPEPVDPLRGGKGDAGKDQFRRKRHRGAADRSNSDEEEYGEETPEFSPPINDFLDKLHRGVRRLTAQQYVVLDFLRHQRRVRISGSAGSGKTLVAAEKALQLSKAHPNVLFLCHNPQLAAYIRSNLTLGTSVQLLDFCSWVRDLAGACDSPFESEWTHWGIYLTPPAPRCSVLDCERGLPEDIAGVGTAFQPGGGLRRVSRSSALAGRMGLSALRRSRGLADSAESLALRPVPV